jgi:hypothetical protein
LLEDQVVVTVERHETGARKSDHNSARGSGSDMPNHGNVGNCLEAGIGVRIFRLGRIARNASDAEVSPVRD